MRIAPFLFAAAGLAALTSSIALSQTLSVHNLGYLPGDNQSMARAINNRGQAVGFSASDANDSWRSRAVLWQGNQIVDLGVLPGGSDSEAFNINDRGQVVGRCINAAGMMRAVLWDKGQIIDLGGNNIGAAALGINNKGVIVGSIGSFGGSPFSQDPTVWQSGVPTLLPVPAGVLDALPVAINEPGQIVGSFLWDRKGLVQLPALPGASYAAPAAINNRGQIVGESGPINNTHRGVIWENGQIRDLNFLPSDWSTSATAINNQGEIVVYAERTGIADFQSDVLRKNTVIGLPPLPGGWEPIGQGINDLGQVVGLCHTSDSPMTAVLWDKQ